MLLLVSILACYAQENVQVQEIKYHQHKGFFLSMGIGPNFPGITDKVAGVYDLKFTGTGALFDLKIGGAIKENLILHATILSSTISGPKTTFADGSSENSSNGLTLGETSIGAGITYYLMPSNIFLSGSLGIGNFSVLDDDNDIDVSTDRGFSMQLKAGKEWWVSRRWALGVALTYSKTSLTNKPGGGVEERMNSNNFGILFNATLN